MVDPVIITALGTVLGGAAGLGSLALSATKKAATVNIPAAAPPVQDPVGSQTSNTNSSGNPSFLAAAATPQTNQTAGTRSLLGQ